MKNVYRFVRHETVVFVIEIRTYMPISETSRPRSCRPAVRALRKRASSFSECVSVLSDTLYECE